MVLGGAGLVSLAEKKPWKHQCDTGRNGAYIQRGFGSYADYCTFFEDGKSVKYQNNGYWWYRVVDK